MGKLYEMCLGAGACFEIDAQLPAGWRQVDSDHVYSFIQNISILPQFIYHS